MHFSFVCLLSPGNLPLHHLPSQRPQQQRHFSSLAQTEQRQRAAPGRLATGRDTARPASSLSALRPDMKGLFREMQGIVIRAFLLLIMVLPEPEEEKKNVDVLFIIICGLQGIYNHGNRSLTNTATVTVPVLILCTI